MRLFLFILLSIFLVACQKQTSGFAFFPADESELSPLEKKLFTPTRFKRLREPISFPSSLAIYYLYQPESPHYGEVYAISLSKFSLGWVEVDLYNQRLDGTRGALFGKLEDLDPGRYLLRIAYENKVIDKIEFSIQENRESDEPDFSTDILANANDADDILQYSQ
ncbi:MAG: hypothetical protein D6767_09300 [Candidatus Hydrogenedentota bacterium]|nr:MAG: hypothetical protein D6767_09300 [Candidatus Hydrogenedentota bacterium]